MAVGTAGAKAEGWSGVPMHVVQRPVSDRIWTNDLYTPRAQWRSQLKTRHEQLPAVPVYVTVASRKSRVIEDERDFRQKT